jgi:hypothetical protein
MSIRLEMLQVARLAPKLLGESTALVTQFLQREQNEDGGFKNRVGQSDLYYTVFALDGLLGLQTAALASPGAPMIASCDTIFQKAEQYLNRFEDGTDLDFVHLCCLARAWASVHTFRNQAAPAAPLPGRPGLLPHLETFRSRDGGFGPIPASDTGTAYACFLALGAHQDLRAALPAPTDFERCLSNLECLDGAWTNELPVNQSHEPNGKAKPGRVRAPFGSTNATAAVVTILRQLDVDVPSGIGSWFLARAHPQGGFLAVPNAPVPDLLSTATALHALAGLQVSIGHLREPCLDFIDSLWTNEGGFFGHWHEDHLDCEYTYYGLLALGHLSL